MANTLKSEFQLKYFGFADTSPEKFYESQWFRSKIAFICYRVFIFLYCLVFSINTTIILVQEYPKYYGYLSDWAEWSLVFYFGIALCVAIYGLITCKESEETGLAGCCSRNNVCQDNLRWFHRFCWVVFTAVICINILVTIMYWALLSDRRVVSQLANIHQHVMNTVLMLIDLFMIAFPIRILHFIYPITFGLTYVIFTLILHGANVMSDYYPGFLNWSLIPGVSAGMVIGIVFIACPIVHIIVYAFYLLRDLIAKKVKPEVHVDGIRAAEAGGEANPAFNMTETNGNLR